MSGTGVTLVIPAWNEPEAIGAVLQEVARELVDEILVVVGSELDPTAPVARQLGATVLVQRTRGYGAACFTGAEYAIAGGSTIIAFIDGDYADPPAHLSRILEPIHAGRADLVLGCRDLRAHPDALPLHARLGNTLVCFVILVMLRQKFKDLPSYKAIRADALRALGMREMTYGWTVEMLIKAARDGLRIAQLSVPYRPRRGGHSKVAGNPGTSLAAAYKLLSCAFTYATRATRSPWSTARGQSAT